MRDQTDDGGPAFPANLSISGGGDAWQTCYGMSLRDYFAAKAMEGLIASNDDGAGDRIGSVPDYAYAIADAMLKARKA